MPCLNFLLQTDTLATGTPAGVRPAPTIRGTFWAHQTVLGVLSLAFALPASANPAPIGAVEPEVVQRARAWVAGIHQINASTVKVQPLDPRLPVAGCAAGWAFDNPFPQNDGVVRARCQDTQWSLFLSVTLPRGAAASRPAPGSSPGVAAGLPASPSPMPRSIASSQPAAAPPAAGLATAMPGAFSAPVPATFPTTTWMPGAVQAPAAPPTPLAVRRGNTVLTTWAPTPGLAVTARLESLDDGRLGDTIRLRNRDSGRVVSAQISGQNQAVGQ